MPRFNKVPFLIAVFVFLSVGVMAQNWPVTIRSEEGQVIKIFAPQPGSFNDNQLVFKSAISVSKPGNSEPVFGMIWAESATRSVGSDQIQLSSIAINEIRFPADYTEANTRDLKKAIQEAVQNQDLRLSRQKLEEDLKLTKESQQLDQSISNKPPKLIYRNHSSMLVVMDGDPVWKMNSDYGVNLLVNSPNTVVKGDDGQYYIYGGKYWYSSPDLDGPYRYEEQVSGSLNKIAAAVDNNNSKDQPQFDTDKSDDANLPVSEVIVAHEPTELIQSAGEANFQPIANTNLLYVENSPNDIFMDINSQQYFILLSGRWYAAKKLNGTWNYIKASELPDDFARIPAGSPKDNVLASVSGTPAAREAMLDAQVPQTAKVDRNTATASVTYDGPPEFEAIAGTRMSYARNTNSTVILYKRNYYLVDNGIWFQSGSPYGPWSPSTSRPDEVDLIPPSYPVYNVKYVYIYDVTPDFIYMGYTPGYLNTFIYGPTIVYGTGYYYRPWHRHYYFPRPWSWGFNMHYNPWTGWSFGLNFYGGWWGSGWYGSGWGWWGPAVYRPAYCQPYYRHYGYYGYYGNQFRVAPRPYYGNRNYYPRNEIYNNRNGVVMANPPRRDYASARSNFDRGNYNRADYNRRDFNRRNDNPGGFNRGNYDRPNNSTGRDLNRFPSRNYQPVTNNRDVPQREYGNRFEQRRQASPEYRPNRGNSGGQGRYERPSAPYNGGGGRGEIRRPQRRGG